MQGPMRCVEGKGPRRVEERRRWGWRQVRRASCPSTARAREPLAHPFPHSILPLIRPFDELTWGFLGPMFHPLSPAKQPYYINLLSFPVTGSLPVNSHFPTPGMSCRPRLPDHVAAQAWPWPVREQRSPRTLLAVAL